MCHNTDEPSVYSDISDNGQLQMVGPPIFRQRRQFLHFWTLLRVYAPCPWPCQIIQITHYVDMCARTVTNPLCIPTFPTIGRWKWSESFPHSDNSDNSDISGHYSGCLSRGHGAAKPYKLKHVDVVSQNPDESLVYSDISGNGSLEMVGRPHLFRQLRQFRHLCTLFGVCPVHMGLPSRTNYT